MIDIPADIRTTYLQNTSKILVNLLGPRLVGSIKLSFREVPGSNLVPDTGCSN